MTLLLKVKLDEKATEVMTNSNKLNDAIERDQALNPRKSFIVQAPAGSGKTELLSQRYLLLLGLVKQPEEILAITFTKKSAAEMRARIIKALKKAASTPEPITPHEKQTWELAKKALAQNDAHSWDLLDNPNRLQIQTIDSFNASLTRQLPLLSHFGAPLEIASDPYPLYRQAVQEFLTHLEENVDWSDAIETLLTHRDNDLSHVESLLINMLAKRDQWMPYIASNINNPKLRILLEKHLNQINLDHLGLLYQLFPIDQTDEIFSLLHFAFGNLAIENRDDINNINHESFLKPILENKNHWLAIAKLLLTEEGTWRKTVTKKQGFPASSDAKNVETKKIYNDYKLRMKNLLESFSENNELRLALKELTLLPEITYQDNDWKTLEALHQILHVIVAQLKLTFQEHSQIDFIENAQAALNALGTEEEPTDITLALDYKIQHILIDEFQDTSNNQYRLLEKLITGWQPDDGRTLFVVGDPMQSIYRFREAEVGLFIRARKQGIGSLKLTPLTLSVNFRSIPEIVNWVNDHFKVIMPKHEDIANGAVTYSPSVASSETVMSSVESTTSSTETAITASVTTAPVMPVTVMPAKAGIQSDLDKHPTNTQLHPFIDTDETSIAQSIATLIQKLKTQHPTEKIAILVRSRTHLRSILPALKSANLTYRALDIEPLQTRPVIQDLLALTRALLHPADRIAWLAILRAPWCGLTLSDLLLIAGDKNQAILWPQLQSSTIVNQFDPATRERIQKLVSVLELSLAARRRYHLREWVETTWQQLGGPACLDQESDLKDCHAFFNLLQELDQAYDLVDLQHLTAGIEKLYAAPNSHADDSLQIMTIHNAKGLEFDTVILPHLERKASQDEKQLLQWIERTTANHHSELILAPIQAIGSDKNVIYEYIKRQHYVRSEHENTRLLYVATTRAKKNLHLFFNVKSKENDPTELKEPINSCLLQKLWPVIKTDVAAAISTPCEISKEEIIPSVPSDISMPENNASSNPDVNLLRRLTSSWKNISTLPTFAEASSFHQQTSGFQLPDLSSQFVGIVMHQVLQSISQLGVDWWTHNKNIHKTYLQENLLQLGMLPNNISFAVAEIEKAIQNTLSDTRGQWILQNRADAQSEYPLSSFSKNLIIDRTFLDEKGIRWIIDYKSTDYAGNDLQTFLEFERKQYDSQLSDYHHALKTLGPHPIRVGLYFPLIPAWKEWNYQ